MTLESLLGQVSGYELLQAHEGKTQRPRYHCSEQLAEQATTKGTSTCPMYIEMPFDLYVRSDGTHRFADIYIFDPKRTPLTEPGRKAPEKNG